MRKINLENREERKNAMRSKYLYTITRISDKVKIETISKTEDLIEYTFDTMIAYEDGTLLDSHYLHEQKNSSAEYLICACEITQSELYTITEEEYDNKLAYINLNKNLVEAFNGKEGK